MASDPTDLSARVEALEQQVAALQGRGREGQSAGPVGDSETFWALQGLRERSSGSGAVLFTGSVQMPGDEPVEWQQGSTAEALLSADWSDAAGTLAALGHPVRLTLLQAVLAGTATVAELGTLEDVGTSGQLYHHLRQLVSAGWLRATGRGRYEVPATRVVPLLIVMTAVQQ